MFFQTSNNKPALNFQNRSNRQIFLHHCHWDILYNIFDRDFFYMLLKYFSLRIYEIYTFYEITFIRSLIIIQENEV